MKAKVMFLAAKEKTGIMSFSSSFYNGHSVPDHRNSKPKADFELRHLTGGFVRIVLKKWTFEPPMCDARIGWAIPFNLLVLVAGSVLRAS